MNSDINHIIRKALKWDKKYQEILLKKLNLQIKKHLYVLYNERPGAGRISGNIGIL